MSQTILFTPHTTRQDYFRRNAVRDIRPAALKVCGFDDHTEWTFGNITATAVISTDTTEYPGTNGASIKIATPVIAADDADKNWRLFKDFTTPWDSTDCTVTIQYYCDRPFVPYGGKYYRAAFVLQMTSAADPITHRCSVSLPLSPGWHTLSFDSYTLTLSGTVDRAAIKTIGISYSANDTNGDDTAWNIWLDYVSFTKSSRSKGGVIIAFDDQYVAALQAAKMLHAEGFRSMIFVEPNTIGNSGRMTLAQLQEAERFGALICSHYQGAYFSSVTPETLVGEGAVHNFCRTIKRGMWNMGFRNGSEFFAIPGGTIFQQSEDHMNVMRQYFSIIRGTGMYRVQGAEIFKAVKHPVGAAVDKGGGLVGIPCEAHGFTVGTWLETTSAEYPSVYTVHADTTADEIVVTATYAAKVWTGTANIYPWNLGATEPQGSVSNKTIPAHLAEPWWRWAVNPWQTTDGDYATQVNALMAQAVLTKGIFEMYDHQWTVGGGLSVVRLAALIAQLRTHVDAAELEVITYEDLL